MAPPSAVRVCPPGRSEWAAALAGAGDEWLVQLLSARPDLLLAGPRDVDALTDAVVAPRGVRRCYDLADLPCRQVLEALCLLGEPAPLSALATLLGSEAAALDPVLDRLADLGMVLRRGPQVIRNPGLRVAIPHPAGLGPPAREVLGAQPVAVLTDMAKRIGVGTKGTKGALVEALVAGLSSPGALARLVAAGPDGTETMARRLAQGYHALSLSYGVHQAMQSDRTPAGWLLRRGLVMPTGWSSAAMPAEVALALRGGRLFGAFVADAPDVVTTPVDTDRVERRAADAALGLVGDVTAVLEAWSAEPAKLLQAGGLGVREVRRVAKLTGRSEPDAARLVELAALAALVDVGGGVDADVALPTDGYDRWLDRTAGARWAWLAEAWRRAPLHLSLAGSADARDKPIPPLLDRPPEPDARLCRAALLDVVAATPPGQAADPAQIAARVEWEAPALWQEGPAGSSRLISWLLEEAELLAVTSGGAVSSFGRCLVDGNEEAAAAALGVFAPPVTAEVILQADLTAVVAGELAGDLRRELDLLGDVESAGAATVYRFTETSLRRGFDVGRSAGQILAFLAGHAPKGVPQPLAYLVEDVGRRFGQLRVGRATCYVRADDPALVAEVVRAKKTARLVLQLLAPTVAVSGADPKVVERTLRDAGYLAAAEDATGTLVLRRPVARRAPAPAPARAFRAPPPTVAEGEEPTDLASLVRRLRHCPPRPAGATTRRGPAAPAPRPRPPFPGLHLLEDEAPRPTHIAGSRESIEELLDEAGEEEWLVRLAYVNSQGMESELYAEVLDIGRNTVKIRRLPGGTAQDLKSSRIRWVRVATEAEEEAQL